MPKNRSKYINIADFINDGFATTFILGARGVGKTIGAFVYMINQFKENGSKGIYLRRYQIEVEKAGIDAGLLSELTGSEITRETIEIESVDYDFILVDGEPAIYMLALNTLGKYKSSAFPGVSIIIYDEFIDIKNRELKNETDIFYQFAMTIYRDFRKYKALFLANNTNIFNCYFLDLEVLPKGRVTKFREDSIKIIAYETSSILDNERNNTPLARIVRKLEGEESTSLDNIPKGNYEDFIRRIPKNVKYTRTYKLNGAMYGEFFDGTNYYISNKCDKNYKLKEALSYDDVDEYFKLVDGEKYYTLRAYFLGGKVFFTNVKTRSMFIKRFKKISLVGGV